MEIEVVSISDDECEREHGVKRKTKLTQRSEGKAEDIIAAIQNLRTPEKRK